MEKRNKYYKQLAYGLAALFVLAYVFRIIFTNYQTQLEVRDLAVQRVEADFHERAKTIATFLEERQEDIKNLVADRTVKTFFENKALGMSMMYGLAVSLNDINNRFSDFQKNKVIGRTEIFAGILFQDINNETLAEIEAATFTEASSPTGEFETTINRDVAVISHDFKHSGFFIISTPCLFKGKIVGWLAGWISYNLLFDNFLPASASQNHEHSLIFTGTNRAVPIVDQTLKNKKSIFIQAVRSALNEDKKTLTDQENNLTYLVFSDHSKKLPFEIVKLIPLQKIIGSHDPKKLFIGMVSIFSFLFLGMILLVQLSIKQQVNAAKLAEAKEKNRKIKIKNRELEAAKNKIEKQNEELKELDKLKDDFLSNTTHELKTPLNGITGLVSSLLDGSYGPIPNRIGKPLEMIQDSGGRLLNMVSQILNFSRLAQTGNIQDEKNIQQVNLADILAGLITDLEYKAIQKNITIIRKFSDIIEINSDPKLLEAIFKSLIENAIKFTREGEVLVQSEEYFNGADAAGVRVVIEDSGIGVNEKMHDKIFDRFYQGFSSEDRKFEGSGIGLSIVKNSLEKLNGSVHLFSKEGIGTQFTVFIPQFDKNAKGMADKPAVPENFLLTQNFSSEKKETKTVTQTAIPIKNAAQGSIDSTENMAFVYQREYDRKALVLVVDDDDINREVVRSKLAAGYEVVFAENGRECLEKIISARPNLVLLDLMMPEMSGYEVLKYMAAKPEKFQHIPVICLSAKTQSASISRALQLGAVDYITKPFNEKELLLRIETHLKQALLVDKAQQSSRTKSEFLANMSHEIRTPMNAIIGFSDMLLQMEIKEEQREYITSINNAGNSLLGLINDILDFSKISAGKMDVENIEFDLRQMVEQLISINNVQAKEKGLDLIFTIPPLARTVISDPHRLRQILTNLINNAVKFTEKGRISLSADIIKQSENNIIIDFSVADTGIGIPKDRQTAIFKSFSQADGTITRNFGGTGLGLTISNQLVALLGGTCLTVKSEPDKGTIFSFQLSFKQGGKLAAFKSETDKDESKQVRVLSPCHILLVEDNLVNIKLATKLLEKQGHTVVCAENGKLGVEAALSGRFDFCLMDMQMPVMDGLTATKEIRKHGGQQKGTGNPLPIFAMTANVMKGDRERCLEVGMNDYISKPIKLDIINEVITRNIL